MDTLDWLVELKTTTWRVERQELYPTLFLLKGMSSLVVSKQNGISFVDMLSPKMFDLSWAIVKSNSVPRTISMVFLLVVFRLSTLQVYWSDQYFCFVHMFYESILLEYLDKFAVEPFIYV